jgi:penicillin-binding protein 1A
VDPVIQIARRFGIRSDLRREYGLALGVSEVNLLELTGAYGVLANRGLRVPVTGIRRVLGSGEEPIDSSPASAERVVREEIAFIAQSLLEGVVERGTAKRGRVSGWSVAAKTGTSQEAMDLWFVGFTSRLAAGLWVGYDQPRSLGSHETAGRVAAPVWSDIMRRALRGLMPEETQMPEGVLSVRVNYQTGQPTGEDDPLGITEYFVRGDMGTPAPETLPRAPEPSTSPPVQPIQTHPESSGQR